MAVDLAKVAKDKKIKYFLVSFVDLFGVLRGLSCMDAPGDAREKLT